MRNQLSSALALLLMAGCGGRVAPLEQVSIDAGHDASRDDWFFLPPVDASPSETPDLASTPSPCWPRACGSTYPGVQRQ